MQSIVSKMSIFLTLVLSVSQSNLWAGDFSKNSRLLEKDLCAIEEKYRIDMAQDLLKLSGANKMKADLDKVLSDPERKDLLIFSAQLDNLNQTIEDQEKEDNDITELILKNRSNLADEVSQTYNKMLFNQLGFDSRVVPDYPIKGITSFIGGTRDVKSASLLIRSNALPSRLIDEMSEKYPEDEELLKTILSEEKVIYLDLLYQERKDLNDEKVGENKLSFSIGGQSLSVDELVLKILPLSDSCKIDEKEKDTRNKIFNRKSSSKRKNKESRGFRKIINKVFKN